jgi:hypothetical protein
MSLFSKLLIKWHEPKINRPNFTKVEIVFKNKDVLSSAFSKTLTEFRVPNEVNLEQVLQILRDKGVKVIEAELSS